MWVVWAPEGEKNKNETVRGRFRREIPTAAPPFLYLHTYIPKYLPFYLGMYIPIYPTYTLPCMARTVIRMRCNLVRDEPICDLRDNTPPPPTHPPTLHVHDTWASLRSGLYIPWIGGRGEGGGGKRRPRTHRLLHSDADLTSSPSDMPVFCSEIYGLERLLCLALSGCLEIKVQSVCGWGRGGVC